MKAGSSAALSARAKSSLEQHDALRRARDWRHNHAFETGRARHYVEVCCRECIAVRCRSEHVKRKAGLKGWRHPVRIGHKFDRNGLAARIEARSNFLEEGNAGGVVEVMQEVREQDEIVARPPVGGDRVVCAG